MRLGSGIIASPFSTWAQDGGEWSDRRLYRCTPREKRTGAHYVRGWVGFGAGLYFMGNRRTSCPYRESSPDSTVVKEERKGRKYGIKTTKIKEEDGKRQERKEEQRLMLQS